MPLIAPNLDTLDFADIVAQARTLIPRYAPEWTNFNETDPGITLVELFAWMTEILIYRLTRHPISTTSSSFSCSEFNCRPHSRHKRNSLFSVARPDVISVIVPSGTQAAAQG